MVPNDSDEELGARLDSALASYRESDQIDVGALLSGSQRRASRLRAQRLSLAVLAAALVIGVPAGYEVLQPTTGVPGPPAAMLPTAPFARSTNHPPPSSSSGRFVIGPAELPSELSLRQSSAVTARPLVDGQNCGPGATSNRPLTGRRWLWSSARSDLTVSLTVTRWTAGAALAVFNELADGTGDCQWQTPTIAVGYGPPLTDQSWSGSSSAAAPGGLYCAEAVVRVGPWIAGVRVQQQASSAAALGLAQQLAADEGRRLAAA